MSPCRSRTKSARHCGGFRLVKGNPPRIVEIHGNACRSAEGLCACSCKWCAAARNCKHEHTYLSMGSITPMFELRFETPGRAKREDGTDYVGPVVTTRPRRADDPVPTATSWQEEVCMDCGMRIAGKKT